MDDRRIWVDFSQSVAKMNRSMLSSSNPTGRGGRGGQGGRGGNYGGRRDGDRDRHRDRERDSGWSSRQSGPDPSRERAYKNDDRHRGSRGRDAPDSRRPPPPAVPMSSSRDVRGTEGYGLVFDDGSAPSSGGSRRDRERSPRRERDRDRDRSPRRDRVREEDDRDRRDRDRNRRDRERDGDRERYRERSRERENERYRERDDRDRRR